MAASVRLGWVDYRAPGRSAATRSPRARESDRLPEPIVTPATKATSGHDEEQCDTEAAAGPAGAWAEVKSVALGPLARSARATAEERADHRPSSSWALTGGTLVLGDEALTPDSSRFWPADEYRPGGAPPSTTSGCVTTARGSGWDKTDPGPEVPADVVRNARPLREALLLTGLAFAAYVADPQAVSVKVTVLVRRRHPRPRARQ